MIKDLKKVKITMVLLFLVLLAFIFVALNIGRGLSRGLSSRDQLFDLLALMTLLIISVFQFIQIQRILSIEKKSSTDVTGIHNKASFEFKMEGLNNNDSDLNLAIISFDLNNLKKTNDTKGHQVGDAMIKGFATLLVQNFPNADAFRTGGDEFVVVMENTTKDNVEKSLNALENATNKHNAAGKINISYAVGYAISEKHNYLLPDELLHLSDGRMYERKQYMKAHGLCEMR